MIAFAQRAEALFADIDEALMSPAARVRLSAICARVNPTVPDLVVECHLGRGADAVDLTVRVYPEQRDRMLAEGGLSPRLRDVFEGWATPGSDLANIPFVELEWDHHREGGEPWIGPAVEPLVRKGIDRIEESRRGVPARQWASYRAGSALIARLGQHDRRWHDRMLGCFEALPPFGCINHLSLLEIRGDGRGEGIRMILTVPRPDLRAFLEAVGWPGDIATFEALLARYAPFSGRVALDLDVVLEGTGPRVAFYVELRVPRSTSSVLREFLEKLESDGLATKETAAALRSWVVAGRGSARRPLTFKVLSEEGETRVKTYLGSLGGVG